MYKRSYALLLSIIILISLLLKYLLSLFVLIEKINDLGFSSHLILVSIVICILLIVSLTLGILGLKHRNTIYIIIQFVISIILSVIIYLNDVSNIMLFILLNILLGLSIKTQNGYNKNE